MGNKTDIAGAVATLGLGGTVWSYFSDKRNKELFDSDQLINSLVEKSKQSEDFASLIFDVWQRHNLESSKERRRFLKSFLRSEASVSDSQFENFSKVEFIIQNASLGSLRLLSIIHSDLVRKRPQDLKIAPGHFLNLEVLVPLVQSVEPMHEQDIEFRMEELGSFGLVHVMNNRIGGTLYNHTKLGFIVVEYINDVED